MTLMALAANHYERLVMFVLSMQCYSSDNVIETFVGYYQLLPQ